MSNRIIGLLCAGALLLTVPAAAGAATKVTFRVEGATKTLVAGEQVALGSTPVVKDGDPTHSCAPDSAAGALQSATHDWSGTWSDGLGYYVTKIRGEAPSGNDFFTLWLNHREDPTGLCETKLKAGDDVLLFVASCVYDPATQGCKNDPVVPLGITAPARVHQGHTETLRVVSYSTTGKRSVVRGARVYANGRRVGTTDRRGRLKVRATKAGRVDFYARATGKVRSEVVSTRIVRR